jgi:toxin CptA
MPHSRTSSAASSRFPRRSEQRVAAIAWRPSRWLLSSIVLLTACASASLLLSGLPAFVAWPAAALVVGYGGLLVRREVLRPGREFLFRASGGSSLDGRAVPGMRLQWRGPLAFASWRDGEGIHHLSWWPDTLPAAMRRELRLAAPPPAEAVR